MSDVTDEADKLAAEEFNRTFDLNVIPDQLKALTPENFAQLETMVKRASDDRRPVDVGSMSDSEFQEYTRKMLRGR